MGRRKIVQIDETKCDGCGLCVPSCAEGAIQIVEGKARLVADVYCDGLGACLGECPQDAITIVEREAEPFDEAATQRHLAQLETAEVREAASCEGSCPGVMAKIFQSGGADRPGTPAAELSSAEDASAEVPSALGHWPIQLHLVPPNAPFLRNADLLLVADCVPFALADFHKRFLRKRPVVIGCPKLDDSAFYVEKLANVITASDVRSLTVIHMEVPCCTGLVRIAEAARQKSGSHVPLGDVVISIRGRVVP